MAHRLSADAKGVYVIAATPFLDDGRVDFDGIDKLVAFYLKCGVQGMTILGVLGEAQKLSEQESVEAAKRLQPDLIISDISMPRLNGLDATREIQMCAPQSKVIMLTVHREAVYVSMAFHAGARGYLLKQSAVAELPQAVLCVLEGGRYIGADVATREEWMSADGDEASTRKS